MGRDRASDATNERVRSWLIPGAAAVAAVGLVMGFAAIIDSARDETRLTAVDLAGTVPWVNQPAPPRPNGATDPRLGLTATLELPDSVVAGGPLVYVVDVTNPTDSPIVLDPCPGYTEMLGADRAAYGLNCDLVGAIDAHASIRFEMRISVAGTTPPGGLDLTWSLNPPLETVGAQDVVTVTAPAAVEPGEESRP